MQISGNRALADASQSKSGFQTSAPHYELAAFEGYLLDRRRWLVTYDGQPIPLKRKAFDLLLYLLDHRDQVVDKETLMRALWGNLIVEDSNVTQQIFLLRKALCKHPSGIRIIETIPGRGYRFVPSLESPSQERPASAVFLHAHSSRVTMTISEESEDESHSTADLHVAKPANRRLSAVVAVSCAMFALGGYGLRYWQDSGGVWANKGFAALRQVPYP